MGALTLNVQHDAGDPRRIPLLGDQLRRLAPDLVALQEVREAQLVELLAGTGLEHTTHQADVLRPPPENTATHGGTAIATRWPHTVLETLERRHAGTHWWTLAAAVHLPAGELLFVAPTTPWRPDAEWARERQAREVTEIEARHRASLPTVVAGDLNAAPDSPSIRHLSSRLTDAWAVAGAGHTWTVDNPVAAEEIDRLLGDPSHRRRIDYVLTGPAARVRSVTLVGARPVDGVWLSDHFGVLADVDVT
jgi:endonuclease/exonuclease/phosphatase family metal-dependent hydrolase